MSIRARFNLFSQKIIAFRGKASWSVWIHSLGRFLSVLRVGADLGKGKGGPRYLPAGSSKDFYVGGLSCGCGAESEKVVLSLERGFYRMVKNTKLPKE